MEPRNRATPGCRRAPNTRKATLGTPLWQGVARPGGVGDPWHARKHVVRNPGGPASGLALYSQVRTGNPRDTPVMHGCRESDRFIVPRKPSNKGRPTGPAEKVEGRERAKGNVVQHTRGRTQSRVLPVTRARPRTAGCVPARHDPRQEPGAVVPPAGICAGGVR
jgi:hypothetical protein